MKKYKLINRFTREEHICYKETVNGIDYYVSTITYVDKEDLFYNVFNKVIQIAQNTQQAYWINKVIATNNL